MKKLIMTIAIVLGLSMTTFAEGGGLFQRGEAQKSNTGVYNRDSKPLLPGHGLTGNQDGDETPLGTGIVVLAGLGAAYLIGKKRREE